MLMHYSGHFPIVELFDAVLVDAASCGPNRLDEAPWYQQPGRTNPYLPLLCVLRHPSAHHHLGTYARGANIPKDLIARYAQTAKFCIIAGCCVNDQCECTMRHLPADQTVDFSSIPARLELLTARLVGNEVAQVVAQHREIAIIADGYLRVEIFAAHDVGVFV